MTNFEELMRNPNIALEYEKAFWLRQFGYICKKMEKEFKFGSRIIQLYKETYNEVETTRLIIEKETGLQVSDEHAEMISQWMKARLRKKNSRMGIPQTIKKELYFLQEGKCPICGCDLGDDWSKIHVDHIVPWDLVGDELENNFQDLCERCNEEKNASTNYIFLKLIGLK